MILILNDIFKIIYEFKENHEVVWFRGHSKSEYKLNSGLYRISKESGEINLFENNIYNSFINYGYQYCNDFYDNKEWNIVFLMQHYGMYTRLLDWTDSFITALYFALKDVKENENACIWMIDPVAMNKKCSGIYELGVDKGYDDIRLLTIDTLPTRINNYTNFFENKISIGSFAIVPRRSNERLKLQNGFFTIQGTKGVPLEEEYKYYIGDFLIKIEIPYDIVKECRDFLSINGINSYYLYGGIEELCNYIKNDLLQIKLNNI